MVGGCGLLTTQRDFLDLSRTKRAPYKPVSLRVVLLVKFSVFDLNCNLSMEMYGTMLV